jgi:polyphosphate kinase
MADDVSDLFNYLTGYSHKSDYQKLLVAPVNLRAAGRPDRARDQARQGAAARRT